MLLKSSQIKSNHFYCHITTAQVPWWVKFLRACSRQCKKNYLHMDSTYLQTVQKTCAKNTYIYSVHIVYYKDILSYQLHIIHCMYTSTLCTHLYIVICEGATDYTLITYIQLQKWFVIDKSALNLNAKWKHFHSVSDFHLHCIWLRLDLIMFLKLQDEYYIRDVHF